MGRGSFELKTFNHTAKWKGPNGGCILDVSKYCGLQGKICNLYCQYLVISMLTIDYYILEALKVLRLIYLRKNSHTLPFSHYIVKAKILSII